MSKRSAMAVATFVVGVLLAAAGGSFLRMRVAAAAPSPSAKVTHAKKRPNIKAGLAPKPEPMTSRIVPIVSLGQGVRVGAAQITGPRTGVHQALVVGQIETTFQDVARIRIFVPLKTESGVDRVPQVNVNGYADLKF